MNSKGMHIDILTTREWAILIWIIIFLIYALGKDDIRKGLINVVKLAFDHNLRVLWEIIFLYVLVLSVIFSRMSFWKLIYIKDILMWFMFSGIIICANAVSAKDEGYIIKVLKDNLKGTIILEFIASTFTFNIWIELINIPIVTIIVLMDALAEREEKYKNVHILLQAILIIASIIFMYKTLRMAIFQYKDLNVVDTFVSFMIPIVYLILSAPLIYCVELYSNYETLFAHMSIKDNKNKVVQKRHRWIVFKVCKLSVRRVLLFKRKYWMRMYGLMDEEYFLRLIEEFKKECYGMDVSDYDNYN